MTILMFAILFGAIVFAVIQPESEDGVLPKELIEVRSLDITYNQWTHTVNSLGGRFEVWLSNQIILYDSNEFDEISATLSFTPISIGKLKLKMRTANDWGKQDMYIDFMNDYQVIFQINRKIDGNYGILFKDSGVGYNLIDLDFIWHDWYIDWDFSGKEKMLSLQIDDTVIIPNEDFRRYIYRSSINKIVMYTTLKTVHSATLFIFEESYLKSYQWI